MSANQTDYRQTETRRVNFVAPEREQAPIAVDAAPLATADTSAVWMPTASPTRDSVSAQDRARGFLLRQAPIYAIVLVLSIAVTLAYTLVGMAADVAAPFMLDRVLVFLAMLAGSAFAVHDRGDRRDYDHSHAGIERKRIDAAVDIRRREIDAELQLRTAALGAQLRMLEMQNRGSEPQGRPQLSDRGQK